MWTTVIPLTRPTPSTKTTPGRRRPHGARPAQHRPSRHPSLPAKEARWLRRPYRGDEDTKAWGGDGARAQTGVHADGLRRRPRSRSTSRRPRYGDDEIAERARNRPAPTSPQADRRRAPRLPLVQGGAAPARTGSGRAAPPVPPRRSRPPARAPLALALDRPRPLQHSRPARRVRRAARRSTAVPSSPTHTVARGRSSAVDDILQPSSPVSRRGHPVLSRKSVTVRDHADTPAGTSRCPSPRSGHTPPGQGVCVAECSTSARSPHNGHRTRRSRRSTATARSSTANGVVARPARPTRRPTAPPPAADRARRPPHTSCRPSHRHLRPSSASPTPARGRLGSRGARLRRTKPSPDVPPHRQPSPPDHPPPTSFVSSRRQELHPTPSVSKLRMPVTATWTTPADDDEHPLTTPLSPPSLTALR